MDALASSTFEILKPFPMAIHHLDAVLYTYTCRQLEYLLGCGGSGWFVAWNTWTAGQRRASYRFFPNYTTQTARVLSTYLMMHYTKNLVVET